MTLAGRLLVLVLVACAPLIALGACGDSDPVRIIPAAVVDTTTLAGTWKGNLTGSGGPALVTVLLKADSTFSAEGDTRFYCRATGRWTVSGGQFISTGADCDGTIITTVAPFGRRRLNGTWSTNTGASGTMIIDKQP